jgi:hypothetical protein
MKKILAVLVLTLSLLASNADYYTGAYYLTKAATPAVRQSGMFDLTFWEDGTCTLDFYYNGNFQFTAEGLYFETAKSTVFGATYGTGGFLSDSYGFKGTFKNGLVTGNFTVFHPLAANDKGKFQATLIPE